MFKKYLIYQPKSFYIIYVYVYSFIYDYYIKRPFYTYSFSINNLYNFGHKGKIEKKNTRTIQISCKIIEREFFIFVLTIDKL